jgi:chlorobactene glucosyltransferase
MPNWLLAALPWVIVPIVLAWRARGSVSLSRYDAQPGDGADLVSIIVPARNEARNIERCLRSILTTAWPSIEVFVVDDHSTDGTGEIARRIAAEDLRVTVLDAPPLPDGWFGKQWACHTAVQRAGANLFLFTDADTRHTAELLPRAVRALRERAADMISVLGTQELGTFWERLLMPQVFIFILTRYGNTERMSRSRKPLDKIANGQFFVVRREAYEAMGGHEAVRNHVAEDLRIAQEVCRAGGSVQFVEGLEYISTRMYEGLGELMRGWGKNVYAGGRDTIVLGPLGRSVLRVVFPIPTLWNVVPFVLGVAALVGLLPMTLFWWAAACYVASFLFWLGVYIWQRGPAWYALLHPLAGALLFVLFARAAWRGDRVEWKGRNYRSVSP